jgi:hypothetical protein
MRGLRAAALLLALPCACEAQRAQAPASPGPASPAWVVEQFYARRTFPELARHITGEYAANYADAATMGARLPPSVVVTSRPLLAEGDRAVFATALRDPAHAEDWYTYLRRENGVWKIEAVRTLALPPFIYMLLDSLDAERARGPLPDSLVSLAETIRLSTRPDSALKMYLAEHESALLALASRFEAVRALTAITVDGTATGSAAAAERRELTAGLRALRLTALSRRPQVPGCIFLTIDGVTDNEVGFIHAPPGCTPPPLSPHEYIYVERVAPGWYLYKTT